jgi:3'-phosphoadenosine 5'-phosphosulfate sulfotransferase (PAPS reductase)/FAD synthetase
MERARFGGSMNSLLTAKTRHILSLSGGKDSAALAVYMRDRVPEMEYIFHDTGHELPETYQYLARLEAYLGRKVQATRPDYNFDKWLQIYGGMIPSSRRRWCTRKLKLEPFESFVGTDPVVNYIGLRADEDREGYISTKGNIRAVYPFREAGLKLRDIHEILENAGLGLPSYTNWGRTRSGCYFCFFQQKIEWVRLKETHPLLFEKAKEFESVGTSTGNRFFWSENESLAELERPERIEEIKRKWEQGREKAKQSSNKLVQILGNGEWDEEEREGCLICQI